MKYKIYAGLGGGFGGAEYLFTEDYSTTEKALKDAYQHAVEEYQSYEESHGILSWEDCKEALQESWPDTYIDDDMVDDHYAEEIEGWINYFIKPANKD